MVDCMEGGTMEVVIYRNIKGIIEDQDIEWWRSFAKKFGINVTEQSTPNTTTLTFYWNDNTVNITIYRLGNKHELSLDYLRLEPGDFPLVQLIDSVIYHMHLSGEKHINKDDDYCHSTFIIDGRVIKPDQDDFLFQFEQKLLKETIFGHIHLALDELIKAQRSGNTERVQEIKESFHHYHKKLSDINKQLHF